jgi:hypothetical protein
MQQEICKWFDETKEKKVTCFARRIKSFQDDKMHVLMRETSRYLPYELDGSKQMKYSIEIVQIGVDEKYRRQGICFEFLQFLCQEFEQRKKWDFILIESVMSKELQILLDKKFGKQFQTCKSNPYNYYYLKN